MFRAALSCALVLGLTAAGASAQQFFADPFSTDAGGYTIGDLVGQNPVIGEFNTAWSDGLNGPATAFDVVATGLAWTDASYGHSGGSVLYTGSGAADTESLIRGFNNPVTTAGGTFYMSGLMSFDAGFASTPGAAAFTGFLNAEEGDASVSWVIGTQFGFRANDTGGVDAVMRNRTRVGSDNIVFEDVLAENILPGEHLFLVKVTPDYGGSSNDLYKIWLDPANTGHEYNLGEPTFSGDKINFLAPSAPERIVDTLVVSTTDVPSGATVGFDEIRMGTALEDVITVPTEPLVTSPITYREGEMEYEHTAVEIRGGGYVDRKLEGSDELLVGGVTGAPFRSVFSFDLDYIPEGTTITGVELEMTVQEADRVSGPATHSIELRTMNPPQDLVEDQVTWAQAADTVPFTVAGGDIGETILSTHDGVTPDDANQMQLFESTAEFVAAAQAALDAGEPLRFAMISRGIEAANVRNFYGFWSDDGPLSSRPLLRITFVPEPATWTLLLLLSIAVAARRGESR